MNHNIESADMRFAFCAAFLHYVFFVPGLESINVIEMTKWIKSCLSPQNAFGQVPDAEAHSAATYCALAALKFLNQEVDEISLQKIIRFCVHRQHQGIHGRIQKTDDSCYTFWTGAALSILTEEKLLNLDALDKFIKSCANPIGGGIAKFPGTPPDPNHSFMSLAGVGVLNGQVDPLFMLTPVIVDKLHTIRERVYRDHNHRWPVQSISQHAIGITLAALLAGLSVHFLQN